MEASSNLAVVVFILEFCCAQRKDSHRYYASHDHHGHDSGDDDDDDDYSDSDYGTDIFTIWYFWLVIFIALCFCVTCTRSCFQMCGTGRRNNEQVASEQNNLPQVSYSNTSRVDTSSMMHEQAPSPGTFNFAYQHHHMPKPHDLPPSYTEAVSFPSVTSSTQMTSSPTAPEYDASTPDQNGSSDLSQPV